MPSSRSPGANDRIQPLIKRRGSPRPGQGDSRSRAIFGAHPFSFGWSRAWNAEAFAEWLETAAHEAEGAFEGLLEAGCERAELADLVLGLYVLPLDVPVPERRLRQDERAVSDARGRLTALQKTGVVAFGGVKVSSETLLALQTIEEELRTIGNVTRHLKGRRVMETVLLARLTAFVHVRDWQRTRRREHQLGRDAATALDSKRGWHDSEVGDLATTFLGGTLADPAKAHAEWRKRNRGRIRVFERSYSQGLLPVRDFDPDEPYEPADAD
jgi:hypothetical protein